MTPARATNAVAPPAISGVLELLAVCGEVLRPGRSSPLRPAATLATAATKTSWQRLQRSLLPSKSSRTGRLFSQAGQVTVTAIVLSPSVTPVRNLQRAALATNFDDPGSGS